MQIIVDSWAGSPTVVTSNGDSSVSFSNVLSSVCEASGLCSDDFWLSCNGVPLTTAVLDDAASRMDPVLFVRAQLRLNGGKGGFGSMLRSMGGKMASKQTTNFQACRDLTGRRLRSTTQAAQLAAWEKARADDAVEREERKKRKLEQAQSILAAESEPKKVMIDDPQFKADCDDLKEAVSSAVLEGLREKEEAEKREKLAEEEGQKKKAEAKAAAAKKTASPWGDLEVEGMSSSEDEDDTKESS